MTTNTAVTPSADPLETEAPKRVLIVASDPAVSDQTGWEIGFWWERWASTPHPLGGLGGKRTSVRWSP